MSTVYDTIRQMGNVSQLTKIRKSIDRLASAIEENNRLLKENYGESK